MSTALLGGGAAGCMLALRLHELLPHERIVIFERSGAPLTKEGCGHVGEEKERGRKKK